MGYFRIFYYIAYVLNFISRMFKRHGKFMLLLACIIIILVVCMYSPKSHAIYVGNDTYTDAQNNVLNAYRGVTLDFIRRLDIYKKANPNDSNIELLYGYLNAQNFRSCYIYYLSKNGGAMINSSPLNQSDMYILIYQPNANFPITDSTYSDYLGNFCDIKIAKPVGTQTFIYTVFKLSMGSFTLVDNVANEVFYIPSILINYYTDDFVNYFYNNYTIEQVELLAQMDEKLETVTDTVQDTNDLLNDDSVSSETTDTTDDIIQDSIDIFDNSYTNSYNTYNNSFLNSILTPIQQMVDGTTTKSVTFTLPFVNYSFTIRSNAIYSHISTTALYTLIQLFWWVTFSIPIYKLLRRIIIWLGTGEFINKPSKFAMYMSDFISQNITPGMM